MINLRKPSLEVLYCRSSFLKLSQWMFELSLHCRDQEPVLLLLGNKADLATADGRQVAGAEAAEFARRHRMIFLETSALITQEVEYAFEVDMNNSGEIKICSNVIYCCWLLR